MSAYNLPNGQGKSLPAEKVESCADYSAGQTGADIIERDPPEERLGTGRE